MSDDTVDDLHAAEDAAGTMATAIAELADAYRTSDNIAEQVDRALGLAKAWSDDYCRPTCGAEGKAAAGEGDCNDDDCCGCPCHDRFEEQS